MIELEEQAPMQAYQRYIHDLEELHGWLEVDLVHNCFLMGEEVGELFKAVRRIEKMFEQAEAPDLDMQARKTDVGDEIVDVMNYLMAIANRLDIDLETAFRRKNAANQARTWGEQQAEPSDATGD